MAPDACPLTLRIIRFLAGIVLAHRDAERDLLAAEGGSIVPSVPLTTNREGVMRDRDRSFLTLVLRALLLAVGVIGGFAAIDAVFLLLVLAGLFVLAPNPYMGLILFVGLPLVGLAGAALVATAYAVLRDRAPSSRGDHHVRV